MAYSAEQIANAKTIINVGQSLGASPRDIQTALMAAIVESGLRNLNYGDRDSLGLFQQRDAWGSRQARLDPVQAARMFFLGGADGQRGLLDFANRNSVDMGTMAQKVQVSAYPDRYAEHEQEGGDLLQELSGSAGLVPASDTPATTTPVAGDTSQDATEPMLSTLSALGADSPTDTASTAAGADAASSPGTESADQQPQLPQLDEFQFLPSSTGELGGIAGSFEDMFPKGQIQGGARQRLADIAKSWLGTPYGWGGNTPGTALDCSGLVQQAYKEMGISLPRISAAQARAGARIGLNQLQVGDLVGWDNSSRNNGADHIAIYIGNGQIVEAPRPGLSVRIRSLDDADTADGAWGVDMSNYF
jgi:cell wall-associated NlpC family hydrolase